jgi:hypothetical protein
MFGNEILTFKEGDVWIAAWSRFDILAQGPTELEACERLIRSIAVQVIFDAQDGKLRKLGSCPKVPRDLLKRYKQAHNFQHRIE